MHLSIVFPAYNEALNIERAVLAALSYLEGKTGEVIVVNDGSADETAAVTERLARAHPGQVRVIHHPRNLGYAATLKDGFLAARGDWIFYTDSDNQFDLAEIDRLFAIAGGAAMVVGYRQNRKDPAPRIFAAKVYNLIVRALFGVEARDVDCAFKLFRRELFQKIRIESERFLIDAEILAKAKHLGMIVREVGVTHYPRTKGRSTVRPGDVARTLKGLAWLWCRLRFGNRP